MSVLHGAGSQSHLRRHPSKAGLRMGALPGAHYDPFVQKNNTFHCPQDKGAEGPVPLALLTCGVAGPPLWATRCEFIRRPHHPSAHPCPPVLLPTSVRRACCESQNELEVPIHGLPQTRPSSSSTVPPHQGLQTHPDLCESTIRVCFSPDNEPFGNKATRPCLPKDM